MEIPAVSVIIPLYNAEKYVGDCLDSILGQTLQNFEVIVVDDCSTDNSYAIVESYLEKFGGRLTLLKTKQNLGNAGYTARNKGLSFSRGEYVWFMDADDFIAQTALEELYTTAKEVDADVTYMGMRYIYSSKNGVELMPDEMSWSLREKGIEVKKTLSINDPHKNLQELLMTAGLFWTPWTKFVQRNFLLENDITFYETISGGDHLWTLELLALSKRLLKIPKAFYFWRNDSFDSMTRKKRPIAEQISTWSKAFVSFSQAAIVLSNKLDVLKNNPIYCHRALINHFNYFFGRSIEARFQVSSEYIYDILRREFENKSDFNLLIPFFFSLVDDLQKNLIINQQQQNQLPEEVKTHIADLEKSNKYIKAYVAELEKFVADSQQYIAELEAELAQLKSKA